MTDWEVVRREIGYLPPYGGGREAQDAQHTTDVMLDRLGQREASRALDRLMATHHALVAELEQTRAERDAASEGLERITGPVRDVLSTLRSFRPNSVPADVRQSALRLSMALASLDAVLPAASGEAQT